MGGPLTLTRRSWCTGLVMLMLTLIGCSAWQAYDADSKLVTGQSLPHRLRATRQDSTRIALTAPFVRSDTLFGRFHHDTVPVPLADIVSLERQRFSISRTLGATLGVSTATLVLTYLIACGGFQCEQPTY
jgi:Na+/serine symporter